MGNKDETPSLLDAEEAFEGGDVETALIICDGLIGDDERQAPVEALYLAAECLLELQEAQHALFFLDHALHQAPGEPILLHARGICLFETGSHEEAQTCFESVIAQDPEIGEALYYLGILAERQGRQEDAEEFFRQAVDRDPENLVPPRDWLPRRRHLSFGV